MAVPKVYRNQGEGAIASYDGMEFVSGIGRKRFYGMMLASGVLVVDPDYSDKIDTVIKTASTGSIGSVLFTTTFQRPAIIEGTAYFNIPFMIYAAGGGSPMTAFASCAIIHSSGGTDTIIGSGSTGSLSCNSGAVKNQIVAGQAEIARLKLKIGDSIKLRAEAIKTASSGSSNEQVCFAHDPAARTPTTTNSSGGGNWITGAMSLMILNLPFVIDL